MNGVHKTDEPCLQDCPTSNPDTLAFIMRNLFRVSVLSVFLTRGLANNGMPKREVNLLAAVEKIILAGARKDNTQNNMHQPYHHTWLCRLPKAQPTNENLAGSACITKYQSEVFRQCLELLLLTLAY